MAWVSMLFSSRMAIWLVIEYVLVDVHANTALFVVYYIKIYAGSGSCLYFGVTYSNMQTWLSSEHTGQATW